MRSYCYRSHLAFLSEEKFDSTDSDLRQLVNSLTQQFPTCDIILNLDDVLNAAIIKTTVFVVEELLKDDAILLHSVHDSLAMLRNSQQQTWKVITSRWILSNLTANPKHHMSYSWRARKYGTLLYRSKSDLLTPLAQALWRV